MRIAEPVDELVHQHSVAAASRTAVQGRLHRARGDEEGLDQERLDQYGEHERDQDEEGQFPPEPAPPSFCHGATSGGAATVCEGCTDSLASPTEASASTSIATTTTTTLTLATE